MRKVVFFIVILANIISVYSQKYISGEISQSTDWRGDIYINGDIIIPRGVVLSIESGSRVFFKPQTDVQHSGKDNKRAEIIVNGVLQARGVGTQSKILFTSESTNPQMNDWYGIVFKNLYNRSILEYCIIEFGYKGITCYGSAPLISRSEIQFNHNSGISCEVKAKPEIFNCVLFGNGFAGINCELASSPIISECTITQNNYGIIIFSRSSPDLGNNPQNNRKSKGGNRIYNNFDYDVYNHSVSTIYAQNNFWNTNNVNNIRQAIYDKSEKSAYGEVIFTPLFRQRRTKRFTSSITLKDQKSTEKPGPDSTLFKNQQVEALKSITDSTQESSPADLLDTALIAAKLTPEISSVIKETKPESVPLHQESVQRESEERTPQIQEPVLEAFLDSGRREYVHRARPTYPMIYLKTGTEGDVLIEVIVNRKGIIDDYRVLKSDGELFTDEAVRALNNFVYKPGTVQGNPVKYKIVERFRFKQNNP